MSLFIKFGYSWKIKTKDFFLNEWLLIESNLNGKKKFIIVVVVVGAYVNR